VERSSCRSCYLSRLDHSRKSQNRPDSELGLAQVLALVLAQALVLVLAQVLVLVLVLAQALGLGLAQALV
jgi:hypothetical protein